MTGFMNSGGPKQVEEKAPADPPRRDRVVIPAWKQYPHPDATDGEALALPLSIPLIRDSCVRSNTRVIVPGH